MASRRALAQILASADDPLNATGTSYTTRVLVGRRDDEHLEVYARTMVELLCKRAPDARPLLLAISLADVPHSNDLFRGLVTRFAEGLQQLF